MANIAYLYPEHDADASEQPRASWLSFAKIREVGGRIANMPREQVAKIKNMTKADAVMIGSSVAVGIGAKALAAAALGTAGGAIAAGLSVAVVGGAAAGAAKNILQFAVKRYKELGDPMTTPVPQLSRLETAREVFTSSIKHMGSREFRKDIAISTTISTLTFGAISGLEHTDIGHSLVEKFKAATAPYLKDAAIAQKLRGWFGAAKEVAPATKAPLPQHFASGVIGTAPALEHVAAAPSAPSVDTAAHPSPADKIEADIQAHEKAIGKHHAPPKGTAHHHPAHHPHKAAVHHAPVQPAESSTPVSTAGVLEDERARALAWAAEHNPSEPLAPASVTEPVAETIAAEPIQQEVTPSLTESHVETPEEISARLAAAPHNIPNADAEFDRVKDELVRHETAKVYLAHTGNELPETATTDDVARAADPEDPEAFKHAVEEQVKGKMAGTCLTEAQTLPSGDRAITNSCVLREDIAEGEYILIRDVNAEGKKGVRALFKAAASGLREKTVDFLARVTNTTTGILAETAQPAAPMQVAGNAPL